MARTISVKGIGSVKAAPDYVVINMELESRSQDYEAALELASGKIGLLGAALESIGFDRKALKTTNFDVSTDYERAMDKNGNYKSVFKGYICSHSLKVEFDFDTKLLARVLCAVSECSVHPELSICFTVKDPSAVKKELLVSAAKNATEKAQILCEASGTKLGELISIDYNWSELSIISHTNYALEEKCMAMPMGSALANIDIEPDDIDLRDTVSFVWAIC